MSVFFAFYKIMEVFSKKGRLFIYFLIALAVFSCKQSKKPENESANVAASADTAKKQMVQYDLTVSNAPAEQAKAKQIEALFKGRKFNGCVLVAEGGKIIFDTAMGYANFSTKEKLSLHSSFHLASVTKQFTAMAVIMLKERGKLSYDDKAKKYLPELPYEDVTIRQLLNHTSGVPNILNYIPNFMTYWDTCAVASNSDIPCIFQKFRVRLRFKPGTRFSYNNTGYVLLALIVERVSKEPFSAFVEKNIFEPLGMTDSKIYSAINSPQIKNRVYGYGYYKGRPSLDEDDIRNGLVGEKGVYSSVIDLYKWDQALENRALVHDSSMLEAFNYSSVANGRRVNYGFGWRKVKNEPQIVYHFGHWRAFKTFIIRFTDDKKTIIILNNTGSKGLKNMAIKIINVLYEGDPNPPDL